MRNGQFVFDAHSGYWDASRENCKNRYGEAFIETFYAFHTGLNPPDPRWTMDYEGQFRKVDPDWYLEEMFVKGDADMSVLSTQVLSDFYYTGFVNPERNAQLAARAPERIIPLGGVDPRAPDAVEQVERQITELGMKGFKWYTAEWRGEARGWKANDPMVYPCYEKALELGVTNHFFHKGPAVEPLPERVRGAGGGAGVRPQPAAVVRRDHGEPALLARAGPDRVRHRLPHLVPALAARGFHELRAARGPQGAVRGRPDRGDQAEDHRRQHRAAVRRGRGPQARGDRQGRVL